MLWTMPEFEVAIQELSSRRWRVILVREGCEIASRSFDENESAWPWLEQQIRAVAVRDGIVPELDANGLAFLGSQKQTKQTRNV